MPQQIKTSPIDAVWAIESSFGAQMQGVLASGPGQFDYQHVEARRQGTTDIIEIRGVLTKYPSDVQQHFGGAAVTELQPAFASAINGDATAVVFVMDSPGGEVSGIPGFADAIYEARKSGKKTIAQVDGLSASANYYLASQCDQIFCTHETDKVGSIGAIRVLADTSKLAANSGVELVVAKTGEMKSLGVPGAPITEEMRAYMQETVDAVQADFSKAVQRGRKMSEAAVKAVSDGRVYRATEAKQLGLIDGIQSLDQTLAALAGSSSSKRKGRNMAGATYAELKAECVGASAEFLISCLDSGIDAGQARANWQAKQNQDVAAMLAENVKLKADLATAQASVATLTTEIAGLKKKPASFIPAGGTSTQASTETEGGGVSARDQFTALVNKEAATGIPRDRATMNVVKKNPEIHAAFLAEMKAGN